MEKNFKYVAIICILRDIMHIGLVILASIVKKELMEQCCQTDRREDGRTDGNER